MKEMFIYNTRVGTTGDTGYCLKCTLLEFHIMFVKMTSAVAKIKNIDERSCWRG